MQVAATGREYSLPTGRFREAKFHWPLSGDEFEERTDATRPVAAGHAIGDSTAANEVKPTFHAAAQKSALTSRTLVTAAICLDHLTVDPAAFRARKKRNDVCYVPGLA